MTSAMISQLLGVLVDSDRHPILLHCVDGTSRTAGPVAAPCSSLRILS